MTSHTRFYVGPIIKKVLICLLMLSTFIFSGCDDGGHYIKNETNNSLLEMLRIGGLDLSPSFEITQNHYVSTADFKVSKISLQAWTKNSDDVVTINGKILVSSGNYNLAVGNNRFTILIKNNQGLEEQYHLTVTRLPELTGEK